GNLIGDNGALALSEALRTNLTMMSLELQNNSIGDNGAEALHQASLSIRCGLVSSESVFLPMDDVSSSISGSDDSNDSDFGEDDDVGEVMVVLLLVLTLTPSGHLTSWSLI
ncbi:hypothetical protein BG003_000500, partial [Podila horticola]